MALISDLITSNSAVYFIAGCCIGGFWLYRRVSAFQNLPGPPSPSFLTGTIYVFMFQTTVLALAGSLLDVVSPTTGREWLASVNNIYGGAAKFGTLFGGRSLVVNDPRAMHHILVKEQDSFEEWSAFADINTLIFGPGLLSTLGGQHKKQRKMLTPAFSVKHLRGMTPMFVSVARELETQISSMVKSGSKEIDVTVWLNRFALEVIGRGGMGHSFGKLSEASIFSDATKQLMAAVSAVIPGAALAPVLKYLGPAQFRRFVGKLIPWSLLQRLVYIADVMEDEAQKILKKQLEDLDNDVTDKDGQDVIGILLRANRTSVETERLSNEEVVAQISTLVFTAMDTTSSAIGRVLHLLALHPDVQEKLRVEVTEAYNHQDEAIDFNNVVTALPYLDAVIKETLRVYPPVPTMFRQTLNDTVLPLLHPITGENGTVIHEIPVEKGTDVFVNIIGSNHNPKTWGEDASEWKPERWLSELPESVAKIRDLSGVFAHQMTFLAGNRACIGFNFAQLEMRVVIAILIQSLEFSVPKDKEIAWNLGLMMIPVLKGSNSLQSQLPLIIKKREI
ncbi:hypothetical protein CVT25_008981 [Psilocybe cyanescens]|uniref:Cytochrome P450 n=1 Tax=Psilocybe cyanescens TaxID=93625 RepID=A0A409XNA9_PSICY|nr:hypothetical protein CVT25_008981 [Psilocybe cyanescens]